MKLITPELLAELGSLIADKYGYANPEHIDWLTDVLELMLPVIVRKCIRDLNEHHDDFIDGHNGKEYFEIVDEILVKVKTTLRELIEETD